MSGREFHILLAKYEKEYIWGLERKSRGSRDTLLYMFLLSIENQNFTNIIVSKVQRFADKHRLARISLWDVINTFLTYVLTIFTRGNQKGKEGFRTPWPKNGTKGSHKNTQHSDNDPVFKKGGIISGKNCLTCEVRQVTCNNCYFLMSSSGMQTLYWLGIQSVQVKSSRKGGLQAPPPPH